MWLNHVFLDTILSIKLSVKFQVPLLTDDMAEEIASNFFKQDKKQYKEKLLKLGLRIDPYLVDANQWSSIVETFVQVLNFQIVVFIY